MTPRKGSSKLQNILTQFSYDHRKLDRCLSRIRNNADELAKMLDTMSPKRGEKKEK